MRIYAHEPAQDVRLIDDVPDTATAGELIEVGETDLVYLDDADEPVEIDVSIRVLVARRGGDDGHHHHLHRHPCRLITVRVNYGGDTRTVTVAPNLTVARVLSATLTVYGIDAATGADLVLRRPGSEDDLSESGYAGRLADGGCAAELNLLPAHREAG